METPRQGGCGDGGGMTRGSQAWDAPGGELLARLEALAARVEEQAARVAALEAENLRLKASPPEVSRAHGSAAQGGTTTRRTVLRRLLGATAAATALAVAAEPRRASGDARATIDSGQGSTANYGLASTPGSGDPLLYLPDITGRSFGVIGTLGAPAPVEPLGDSGVLGLGGSSGAGVWGLALDLAGVLGESHRGAGVAGLSQVSGSSAALFLAATPA